MSYLKEGKNKLAYASFFRALNIEPKISLTNYNYGIIKEIQNNWKEAGESYYIAGLQSIKENNKKRLYKSLKSLERVRGKNIFLEELYIRLNQKVLTFLKNV